MPIGILWPTFVLVALVFAVWLTMIFRRMNHIKAQPPGPETFADADSSMRYFRPVEMPANNQANLFEMPVLYFALVPLLLITHHGNHLQVLLAWIYVGLRIVHTLIHVGPNKVTPRFMAYLGSCIALSAMWIGFAVDMAAAASAMPS